MFRKSATLRIGLTALAVVAIGSAMAQAAYYWDSNSTSAGFGNTNGTWGSSAFWSTSSGGTATPTNATILATDDLNFGTATYFYSGTVTVSGAQVANSLTFGGTSAVTLSGGTSITLGNGTSGAGGITVNSNAGSATISTPLTLNNTQTWTNNSTAILYVNGNLSMGANTLTIDGTGPVTFNSSLTITGAGGITKNGSGTLDIYQTANNMSGNLVINGGQVFTQNMNLGTGNLTLNGGVLVDRWGGNLTRNLGSGAGQVQITGGESGFCGQGTTGLTVKLGNSDSYVVQWGSTYFNPSTLVLQSPLANTGGNLVWRNPLDLNGAARTIKVNKDPQGTGGNAQIDGLISNSNSGSASGITKTGPGVLRFTNTGNSYNGPTVVQAGVLQLGTNSTNAQCLPGGIGASTGAGSNLEINGGNVRFASYLKRTLGAGAGQIQFTGGTSGISQAQADTYGQVTFNNDSNYEVVWGSTYFQPSVFVLNESNALPEQVVNFTNKLDLNGANRTVAANSTASVSSSYVNASNGYMLTTGGRITGDIRNSSGTAAGLVKTGPGVLQLTGANTYDGGTTINQGDLQFTRLVSMPAAGNVTVNDGATLTVNVGGVGEWTAGASGNGTIGGLVTGLGGQSGGTVSYSGNASLGLNVSGSQTYSGAIPNAGTSLGITLTSSGTLALAGNNTYSGDTKVTGGGTLILSGDNSGAAGKMRISNGYLKVGENGAGRTAGKVQFESSGSNPAILQASGTLNLTFSSGTGSNSVYWTGPGGFAATDSPLTITANGGATVDWRSATTGFGGDNNPQMGSPTSTASVTITNNLNVGYGSQIRLFDNPASSADISILSGKVTFASTYTLTILGSGTLWLQGSNDFKSGTLDIQGGCVVRAVDGTGLPSGTLLYLNGGVFESNGSFTRNIANSATKVYWAGNGGFAANGGALNVNLAGGTTLDWSSATLGFNSKTLILGSPTANNVVTMQNNIDLKGNRTITVNDNPDSTSDYAVVSGNIANGDSTARNLTKDGAGTLVLSGANAYTGTTTVSTGTLVAGTNAPSGSAGAFGTATSEVVLGAAGGNVNAGILAGGAYTVARNIRIPTSDTTDAGTRVLTLGGNTAHASEFSGNIILGTASQAGRGVTLTAAAGGQVTFSGVIQNPASMDATTYTVKKEGTGTVILTNTNTYTGATQVNAGTLLVNNNPATGSGTGTGSVTVAANATLGGTGKITGATTINGNIAPGSGGVGTLAIVGNLTINGSYLWDMTGTALGEYDRIALTASTYTQGAGAALVLNHIGSEPWATEFTNLPIMSASGGATLVPFTTINPSGFADGEFSMNYVDGDLLLSYSPTPVGPPTGSWKNDAAGDWNTTSNWTGSKPVGVGAVATFGNVPLTADRTVTVDQATIAGQIVFDTDATGWKYTLAGANTLTMEVDSGSASITDTAGSHEIAAPLALTSPTTVTVSQTADTLTVSGLVSGGALTKDGPGSLVLSNGSNSYNGTTVTGGTLVIGSAGALPSGRSLSIGSGGTLILGGGMAMGTAASAEPVPEPGTLALLAIAGLAGVMIWRKRK